MLKGSHEKLTWQEILRGLTEMKLAESHCETKTPVYNSEELIISRKHNKSKCECLTLEPALCRCSTSQQMATLSFLVCCSKLVTVNPLHLCGDVCMCFIYLFICLFCIKGEQFVRNVCVLFVCLFVCDSILQSYPGCP